MREGGEQWKKGEEKIKVRIRRRRVEEGKKREEVVKNRGRGRERW